MRKKKSFKLTDDYYEFEVKPKMLNHINTLHGGELVKHFDNAAGKAAIEFSENRVVTAAIKEVNFFKKIEPAAKVIIRTEIFNVGRSSIYTYSKAYIAADNNKLNLAAEAFLIFVGIDANFNPTEVPLLVFDSSLDKFR